jgi:hypothetical protein
MKKISEVRKAFWNNHPEFKSQYRKTYRQNQYNATIRSAFVAYIDGLKRDNVISESLANKVTL